jgi:hypothetical protein
MQGAAFVGQASVGDGQPAITASPEEPTRVCNICGVEKPIEQYRFPHRNKAFRERRCRACYNLGQRRWHARRRSRDIERFTIDLAKAEQLETCEALIRAMVTKFCGLSRFTAAWKSEFDASRARIPGSRTVQNHFLGLLRLMEIVERERPRLDLNQLTDEELDELKAEAILDLIREHPLVAVKAAEVLGWQVVQPDAR